MVDWPHPVSETLAPLRRGFFVTMTRRAQDIYSATLIIGAILIVWGGMAWLLVDEVARLFN